MKHFFRKIYLSRHIKKTKRNGSLQKHCKQGKLVHAKEMVNSRKPKTSNKRECGFASVNQPKPAAAASSKLEHTTEIKATVLKPQENRPVKKKSSGAEKQREVQNGKTVVKPEYHKRKSDETHEIREDGSNKKAHLNIPFKKQKGNTCERYNSRNPQSNTRGRMGHVDCRNFTRYTDPYAPKYAVSALNSYHEPQAGYSGYVQTVLVEPDYRNHSSRYVGRGVLPVVQPYSLYYPSEYVQIAHDPYRAVQRGAGGAALCPYVEGPLFSASQVRNPASYYQACSSYSGAYHNQQTYY